jgi:hypothetical protein
MSGGDIGILKDKIIGLISLVLWALFLFTMWVILSHFIGTEGQWWSLYNFNPTKPSIWKLEASYIKIFISAILSFIPAYFITNWFDKEKQSN